MKKAQFKEFTFKTAGDFNTWLMKTSAKAIHFEDKGQDMRTMYVHKSGEILHCDFHARIYNGKFVGMESLNPGKPVLILEGESFEPQHRLIIEFITDIQKRINEVQP